MSFYNMLSASCCGSRCELSDAARASCGFALVLSSWTLALQNPEPSKSIGHRVFTQHWKGNKGGSSGCITTHWSWTHSHKMFYLHVYVCTTWEQCPRKPKKVMISPRIVVTDDCSWSCSHYLVAENWTWFICKSSQCSQSQSLLPRPSIGNVLSSQSFSTETRIPMSLSPLNYFS